MAMKIQNIADSVFFTDFFYGFVDCIDFRTEEEGILEPTPVYIISFQISSRVTVDDTIRVCHGKNEPVKTLFFNFKVGSENLLNQMMAYER